MLNERIYDLCPKLLHSHSHMMKIQEFSCLPAFTTKSVLQLSLAIYLFPNLIHLPSPSAHTKLSWPRRPQLFPRLWGDLSQLKCPTYLWSFLQLLSGVPSHWEAQPSYWGHRTPFCKWVPLLQSFKSLLLQIAQYGERGFRGTARIESWWWWWWWCAMKLVLTLNNHIAKFSPEWLD